MDYQSPCQVLLQSYPNSRLISSIPIKVFGCIVIVHIHSQHYSKLDPKVVKCLFLGYSLSQKELFSQSLEKSYFDEMGALEKTLVVKNAFLNGDLEEEVYMEIPLGFERNNDFKKVCKLRKALYVLKESTRARFDRFTKVDDIILTGDYDEEKVSLENLLTKEFEIKDLNDLKYFL
ncbi:hypothetical protein AAG906_008050 [Vitis piasezkii]